MGYKYLIDVDGLKVSPLRVPWKLYTNCVLLKQESNKIQWFYYKLLPKYYYFPIKKDLSNLV